MAAALAAGLLAWPAAAAELVVASPRTGRELLRLPVERVRRLTLTVQHSYDLVPVSESFVIEGGRLRPTAVAYASDTYDYRDTRYPACRRRVAGGRTLLTAITPGPGDRPAVIRGRVAHGPAQRLVVETDRGRQPLALDLGELGPGGTPYEITVRDRGRDHGR